jgi:hypothetical protein
MTSLPVTLPPVADRTAEDWLGILCARLDAQTKRVAVPIMYYNGDHPLQFATSKFKEAFGNLFSAFADNWCEIVVDAPVERLQVIGFRTGGQPEADTDAWDIWQDNALDVNSVIAHTEAGKCGTCYLLVDPNGGEPLITVEHPEQVIVATDPGNRLNRLAALKRWADEDGRLLATVYLPDHIFKFEAAASPYVIGQRVEWKPRTDSQGGSNSLGVVPVIPMDNNPSLLLPGVPDLKPAMPIQNAINKLCTDMIVASEFGAFRQRVLTGVEIPRDPETGRPLGRSEIVAAMSRLWTFESENAKVYDLNPTDLGNFVKAIEMFKADLAAQTRTPPHYLLGQVVNASGDALKVAEAGLVSKCRKKILFYSDPWEAAMALALQASGRTDIDAADVQSLWANPERITLAELVDASVKKRTLGIPLEELWLELGYTPAQIEDMKRLAGLPERPPTGATTASDPFNAISPTAATDIIETPPKAPKVADSTAPPAPAPSPVPPAK